MGLTCPNCGNERSFLAKTLQTHVVQSGGKELELTEQSRPPYSSCSVTNVRPKSTSGPSSLTCVAR